MTRGDEKFTKILVCKLLCKIYVILFALPTPTPSGMLAIVGTKLCNSCPAMAQRACLSTRGLIDRPMIMIMIMIMMIMKQDIL